MNARTTQGTGLGLLVAGWLLATAPNAAPASGLVGDLEAREGAVAAQLAAGGEIMIAPLFESLVTGLRQSQGGTVAVALTSEDERVIVRAMSLFEPRSVESHVRRLLAKSPTRDRRRAAVQALGAVGRSPVLFDLFDLALERGEPQLDGRMERALERAIAQVLRRDGQAFEVLPNLIRILRPELSRPLVHALGTAGDPRGLNLLSHFLEARPDLATEILDQIAVLGPSLETFQGHAIAGQMRAFFGAQDLPLVRAAVRATAAMGDVSALEKLIPLRDSDDALLAQTVQLALVDLVGPQADTAAAWERWHEAERAWILREREAVFEKLSSYDLGEVEAALRECVRHPLVADQLVESMRDLLSLRSVAVKTTLVQALASVPFPPAVGLLVGALEDECPEVAQGAWKALVHQVGRDVGSDPAAWRVLAEELGHRIQVASVR